MALSLPSAPKPVAAIDSFAALLPVETPTPPVFSSGLRAALRGDRLGYQDSLGQWRIEPKFTAALPFEEGWAAVRVGDGDDAAWGFIDTSGHWRVDPLFTDIASGFHEGLAVVGIPGLVESPYAYIDTSGGMAFGEVFHQAKPFFEGRAEVQCGPSPQQGEPYAWGIIDATGEWIKPCTSTRAVSDGASAP